MPRIVVLDEATANQIAAGEVAERPASVVKELVENSLDAGATRVNVEIRGGGLEEIKVVDNGCGMDETDSVTALQRHATSKINSISDLEDISSLGFRGEALPSIAAVSKTVLITRPPGADSGTRLEVQGGRVLSVSPAGCPPGTSISVKELFFNTPARLKFMKTKATEAGLVSDTVSRLALARPGVGIRLVSDGRTVLHTPGTGELQDALAAVYGSGVARGMLDLENEDEGISLRGLIAPPAVSRGSKRHITVILNGRHISNHLISAAVTEGFGAMMPRGRYPIAVLVVYMDPRLLDVNVHPAKMVVRISGENRLYNLVRRSVTAALRTDRIIPPYTFTTAAPGEEYTVESSPPAGGGLYKPRPDRLSDQVPGYPAPTGAKPTPPPAVSGEAARAGPAETLIKEPGQSLLETTYPIGFLPPTYILAGNSSGMVIIDHHAAHERILYERFLALLSRERVESQIMLVPAVVQLTPRECQAAEENLEILASLGIGASGIGSGSLLVREIPAGLAGVPAEDLIGDLLEYLMDPGSRRGREDLVKKLAASAACKAAVKSGTKSTLEEARAIIRDLGETSFPYTCPHGRPTMISISEQEIRGRFRR